MTPADGVDPARAERERLATEARVTARFAGHADDPWLDELSARWVEGELTLADLRAAVEARYAQHVSPHSDQEER